MLEIALLGHFEVRSDGERIELPSRTQQKLLAYLALRAGQTVPRAKLAGLLWPDVPEAKARKNLRHHLWRLRQAIGEECLATSQETVALDAAVLDCLDADLLAQDIGDGDLAGLVVAVSAYKGELLPGFYDDWVQVDRERLQALFERQMDTLLERLAAEGRWSNLVRWSEHWIALVQAPEPAYRALMRGHAGLGDLAAVARVYERCQKALTKELGVEPAPQTRALYDSLRAGQAGPPRVNTLPLHSMPFVGRQRELAQLDQSLADTDVRLITIIGVGGAGKTRLAYAAAQRQLQRQPPLFAEGVYAASLASYDSPEQLLPAIADAVGLPSRQRALELDHLTNHLREKAVLLVLDNFEHLLEGAGVLAKLLQGTANLKVLVTSRERLALRQERVFPLGGLADGQAHSADDAREEPFLQLFLHSARRVRPDFELVSEDVEHVAQLRHMTGGLPLAVELAASWVEVLPLAEIVGEMGRDLDFLQSDLRDLPRRQRSMRAVFEATWRRLEPEQRAHFSYLCLFRGGFTREAAQEVAGASLRTLATLSAKSLVEYDAARDRYEIHELLRQFGERELQREPDEEHRVRRRHAVFYCQWLRQKQQAWVSEGAPETPAEMDQERGNVRLAWKWAAEQGEVSLMAQSLYALGAYYIVRGPFVEARRLLRTVESLLSAPAESAEEIARRRLLARVVHWQGRMAPSLGEARSALDRAETMLAELRQQSIDVRAEEAFLSFSRGWRESGTDNLVGRTYLERAHSLYEELGDSEGQAYTAIALANLEYHLGHYCKAAGLLRQILQGPESLADRWRKAKALELLGSIEKHRGRLPEAQQANRQSSALFREVGDYSNEVGLIASKANTLCWSGNFAQGRALALQGLQKAEGMGQPRLTAALSYTAAWACLHAGRYEEARPYVERAVTVARAFGEGPGLGWALTFQGQLSLAVCSYEEAVVQLEEAAAFLAETRKSLRSLPLVLEFFALRRLGRASQARETLIQALRENGQWREYLVAVNGLPAAALLMADQCDVERALELYALARRYPHVANSRWFEDVMGEEVGEWAASLPRDAVEAARGRGRRLDLWETAEELIVQFGEA